METPKAKKRPSKRLIEICRTFTRPRPDQSASEWSRRNVVLGPHDGGGQGPLSWAGREWAKEICDSISTPFVEDVACCIGTQLGKTVMLIAMYGYVVACDPSGLLWVLPGGDDAVEFSRDRVMPMAERTTALKRLIPRRGRARQNWTGGKHIIGGARILFRGSNSPAKLAGNPMRRVFCDEMEKFPADSRGGEAGAINLALQRTGAQPMPFRFRCSSPAMSDGPGWQEFIKGDQRRYAGPCPGCGKDVVLTWGPKTRLIKTGLEAFAKWDPQCEREDGNIDFDRVHRSARWECPHCQTHVQDHHKLAVIRGGRWIPTAKAPATFRSYHLPSLYSISPNKTLGAIVAEFLTSKGTLEGLRGWINGTLAEPWDTEAERAERTELFMEGPADPDPKKWERIMTVDVQRNAPEFWVVVREWEKGGTGNSRLIVAEAVNGIDNLRQRQAHWGVADVRLGIDVKDGVRREEILGWIMQTGKTIRLGQGKHMHAGWIPLEGYEREKRWKDKSGNPRIVGYELWGSASGNCELRKLEFAGDMILDILALLRKGPKEAFGIRWEVPRDASDAYWAHMDAKVREEKRDPKTGRKVEQWVMRRHKTTQPEHWLDAEAMQIAMALFLKLLPWGQAPKKATT